MVCVWIFGGNMSAALCAREVALEAAFFWHPYHKDTREMLVMQFTVHQYVYEDRRKGRAQSKPLRYRRLSWRIVYN